MPPFQRAFGLLRFWCWSQRRKSPLRRLICSSAALREEAGAFSASPLEEGAPPKAVGAFHPAPADDDDVDDDDDDDEKLEEDEGAKKAMGAPALFAGWSTGALSLEMEKPTSCLFGQSRGTLSL